MKEDDRKSRMSLKEPPPPYTPDEEELRRSPTTPTKKRTFLDFVLTTGMSFAPFRRPSGDTKGGSLLDSGSTTFNAATLHAKLQASDRRFAEVIFQLIKPKIEEGHLSYLEGCGWGFTFTEDVYPLRYRLTGSARTRITRNVTWTGCWDSMPMDIRRDLEMSRKWWYKSCRAETSRSNYWKFVLVRLRSESSGSSISHSRRISDIC